VSKVGIVGAGLMARQIATLFLRRLEVPIVIRDVKQEIVDEALADISADVDSQVAKGRYDEGKGRFLSSLVSAARTTTPSPTATSCSRPCSRSSR